MNIQRSWVMTLKFLRLLITAIIWIGLTFSSIFVPGASAYQSSEVGESRHPGVMLGPDGALDLNSGYRGVLDRTEWRMASGPDHTPLFAQILSADGHWDDVYGLPGMNNRVFALALDGGGSMYAGGDFLVAGNLFANRVARWDGINWNALGSGANGHVNSLVVDASNHLFMGGEFTDAGGVTALRIAMWDGITWSPLGTGMNNAVMALLLDGNGNLYAGGSFTTAGGVTVNRVAMWDGSTWQALGSGMNNTVNALAMDSNGNLYAGGEFTNAGGNSMSYIAMWDGSVWSALDSGMSSSVYALAVDAGDNLYAGGNFINAGGVTVNRVAMWDGVTWSAMDGGVNNRVYGLEYDAAGQLYVSGQFTTAGGNEQNYVAVWDGDSWSSLGGGLSGTARAVKVDGSGSVYVGGDFLAADGVNAYRLAVWDNGGWSKTGEGKGMNDSVLALAMVANEELYVGGDFQVAGDRNVNRIAHWDGSNWDLLWGGMNNNVQALVYDGIGNLYAGGAFTFAGGLSANRIARWNGSAWFSLGTGLNNQVRALVLDGNGNLYVGGIFTTAGGITANYVAKWDGSSWSALGSGMNSYVYSLAMDGNGNLYAGGNFTTAGGVSANHIAMWDGSTWSSLGTGMDDVVYALVADGDDNLYAGGSFVTAGDISANRIAIWDGSEWSPLGSGMNNTVQALLAAEGGYLYAGGSFSFADGASANRIALWNGNAWTTLGNGMNTTVMALAADQGGNLYAGGDFVDAGDKPSYYVARWFNDPPVAVDDSYNVEEDSELIVNAPGVLLNDLDVNQDPLTPNLENVPPDGTLNFLVDGSFVYTPTVNYNGLITFTYSITDGFGGVDTAQVAITVTGVNDPPVAENDIVDIVEDTPTSLAVLSNDTDVDEDILNVESVGFPAHGTAVISETTHVFYSPALNYYGMDVFTYTMSDGVITDSAIITVTVVPVNDPPLALNDTYATDEDIPLSIPAPGVLGNDTDAENQPINAVLESSPLNGDLSFTSQGDFIYTPTLNYHGMDSFTYHATDGISNSNTATVNLMINSVNDVPEAADDYYDTDEDTPIDVDAPGVLGNDTDADGDDLIAALFSGPLHGVLTLYQDGSFQYSPVANYYGLDVFTYTVTDVNSGTHTAQAYITVASVNDLPLVDAGEDQTVEEGQLLSFSGTFLDPGLLSFPLAEEDIKWDFGDGTFVMDTLEPTHTYVENGTYTVTLTVTDTQGGVGQDDLVVVVENQAPMLPVYSDRVNYIGSVLTVTLTFTDPGLLDAHMVVIQWGDGISQSLDLEAGVWDFTASHAYQKLGLYTAVVSVWDDDGGVGEISFKVDVLLPGYRVFMPVVSRR